MQTIGRGQRWQLKWGRAQSERVSGVHFTSVNQRTTCLISTKHVHEPGEAPGWLVAMKRLEQEFTERDSSGDSLEKDIQNETFALKDHFAMSFLYSDQYFTVSKRGFSCTVQNFLFFRKHKEPVCCPQCNAVHGRYKNIPGVVLVRELLA